ncbi:integrase, catalytic region, zinc finger, CCHC-type containing protein [Tanacetum coccineum]
MKDVFDSTKNDLSETWKQNELLKDQLLEANLKHEIECCVLLIHGCLNNNVQDEIEKIQRDSIEIQEGMQKRIKILENDVQRCQKQSLDFELQLQHEKERQKCESSLKNVYETSWISKMEKLERLSATSSVKKPLNRDSPLKNSILFNTKKSSKKVDVYVRTNKKAYVASKNIVLNKTIISDVDVKNAFKVKDVLFLGQNLFSVGQFCDGDLEVAFRSNTCYVRNLEGDDLLIGARESNLYTISISDMAASSPVCLLSKATLTKSWLWHRRLSHLNFEYFEKRYSDVSINFAAQQVHNHEYSPLTSSIIVEEYEAPSIVTTSEEQTSPISLNETDGFNQEDSADFVGNTIFVPYDAPNFEEVKSSTTALDP